MTRLMAAGFAGTLVMTAMMYFVAPMMGVEMDIAAMLGSMLGGSWAMGLAMHFMNGSVVFPLAFGYVVSARLTGPAAVRGMLFGVALWPVAQTMLMPMMGAGLFSANAGGMVAVVASLMGHLVYGGILGQMGSAPSSVHAGVDGGMVRA